MAKKVLSIYLIFFISLFYSQSPAFKWAKAMTGSGFGQGITVTTDINGNVIVGGSFYGTLDFDTGPGISNYTSVGNNDMYLTKHNKFGGLLWTKHFVGSIYNEEVYSVKTDALGNIYATGYFNGTVDFDPGLGVFNLTAPVGYDVFVVKLDPAGNFVFAKAFGGNDIDWGYSIDLDNAGNVYVGGYFQNTVDFDPGVGVFNMTSFGNRDNFICKLDGSGNFIWAKQIGGTSLDELYSINVDVFGNVLATGIFEGTTDFDPSSSVYSLTSFGSIDIFVVKLNSAGNFIWAKQFGSTEADWGISITSDQLGDVSITGYFRGTSDFDPGIGVFNLTAPGVPGVTGDDVFISKLNSAGNFMWAKQIGAVGNDRGWSITTDINNNIYSTGHFLNTVDFDPSSSVFNLTAAGSDHDLYINKFDASGSFIWARRIGSTDYEIGLSITTHFDCDSLHIYTTGEFNNTVDFDQDIGVYNIVNINDAPFIHKMSTIESSLSMSISVSTTSVSCNGLSNGSGTVSAIGGTGFTYTWSPIGGSTSVASGLSAGIYTCHVSNSCGSISSQTFQITEPTAISVTVSPTTSGVCAGSTSTLTAVVSGGTLPYTYTWSSSSLTSTTTVSPIVTSQYTVNVTDFNLCTSSQTVLLNVFNTPTIGVSNGTICSGETYTILPTGGLTYTYSSGTSIVNPLSSTNYTVIGTDINGCIGSSTLSVIVNSVTVPVIVSASPTICIGSTYTLSPTGAVSYTYSSGGNVINPTTTSTYTIYGSNSSTLCPASGSLVVTVYVVNNPTISISSSSICSGSMYTLTPTGALSYTYSSGSNIINPLTNTTYTITGVNAFGCEHTTTVSITVLPSPTLTAISDVTITPGDQTSLTAISNATGYVWSPSTNLSCNTCSTTIASPTESTRYCVIGSLGSCTVETCVDVVLDESCKSNINKTVPTAFSPNGDGVNDMYCLQGWDLCVNSFYIAVYDRWGERVYESTDTNFCWDGYYKGKLLLPAVFVYYIKAEGVNIGTVNKKGNITLLK